MIGHLSFVSWGQCELIPISHSSSVLRAGEDVLVEMARYKSCLERMFELEGMKVLYLEAAVKQKSVLRGINKSLGTNPLPSDSSRHTVIDVIPVKERDFKAAVTYFREVSVFYW